MELLELEALFVTKGSQTEPFTHACVVSSVSGSGGTLTASWAWGWGLEGAHFPGSWADGLPCHTLSG